jgi:DNA invertase Pin-like site-specific DNA recombinase
MLTMLAAIAEFEKGIMLERQREGIDVAKEDGKYNGRKPIEETKLQQVQTLVEGGISVSKAVSEVGIGRRTYYKGIEECRI